MLSLKSVTKFRRAGRLERQAQETCARYIRWLLDGIGILDGHLRISGWAIAPNKSAQRSSTFLVNGIPFKHIRYPIASPDIGEFFPAIPTAQQARFQCSTRLQEDLFPDGFLRLEFLQADNPELARRSAWYFPDPENPIPLPDQARISRVIGTADLQNYLLGGAAIFNRFDHYLRTQWGRPLCSFFNILDWGCGSGRTARYLTGLPNSKVWGADIDADNITWCKNNLPRGKFTTIPLMPRTELPSNHFDLIIGISVLTHLDEESQFRWLEELQRVLRPGGILLLSIQGLAQAGLYRTPEKVLQSIQSDEFVVLGRNGQLDDVFGSNGHYLDVIQSRDYIRKYWAEYFTILDIVDALAANQDVIVMRSNK